MIGESNGDTIHLWLVGDPLTGSNGEISITIPWVTTGDLFYFCTSHDGMVQAFQISNQNDFILTDGFSIPFLRINIINLQILIVSFS